MLPPDDGCVGLGHSTVGTAGWYEDVYVADDYNVNKCLFGYQGGRCTGQYGYYQPAPSATSGSPSGDGQTGVGPGLGFTTFTSPARVVLISDFPENGLQYPGGAGVSFWGTNFKGYWSEGDNVGHMDGHVKYYKETQLMPPGQDTGVRELALTEFGGMQATRLPGPASSGGAPTSPLLNINRRKWVLPLRKDLSLTMSNKQISLFPLVVLGLAGCSSIGDAPQGLSASETRAAVAALPAQQQIDYINRSPMPADQKAKRIADIKAAAGIK